MRQERLNIWEEVVAWFRMDQENCRKPAAWTELESESEITAALNSRDDERLWESVSRHPNQEHAMRLLAEETPRLAYRRQTTPLFAELFLVPVIERRRDTVLGNAEAWKVAERCISEAVSGWFGKSGRHMIFRGVRPYDWIASWEPSTLRQHLLVNVPGATCDKLEFQCREEALPDCAPRLGFVTLTVTREGGWPQLPLADTLRDIRFRHVVGHALDVGPNSSPPEVLAPDQVSTALANGLCLWIALLHESMPIATWEIAPCSRGMDAVKVTLRLKNVSTPCVNFTLRKHQLGQIGVDCVASLLTSVAPMTREECIH